VRALGVLFVLAWTALTLPALRASLHDPLNFLALLALLVLAALLAALAPVARAAGRALLAPPPWLFVAACALGAAAISHAFLRGPMGGKVLSIDGTVYLMEARALAHGHFGMPLPAPRLPLGARFLFEGPDGRLYGVFPPGYPLFLVPFVAAGVPLLAGPFIAALLVLAQYALGRATTRDELPSRLAILLSLPSLARAVETADLLSHALVAVLAGFAIACCLRLLRQPSRRDALVLGACVGWAFAARLLDGVILGLLVGAVLAHGAVRRRVPASVLALALLAAAPFAALVAAQQRAATGSFTTPTQTEYFARSDHPPGCHRLGFGRDVGCAVEHPDDRRAHGDDGYSLDDAARVVRARAGALGEDLFGLGALALAAFALVALRPRFADALGAGFVVALTLGYGLFYYGNAPIYGARHLFPAAPFLYLLLARAATAASHRREGRLDAACLRGMAVVALPLAVLVAQQRRWWSGARLTRALQAVRVDLRALAARRGVARGVVVTRDPLAPTAAMDTARDDARLLFVLDDLSGLRELRRVDPSRPGYLALDEHRLEPVRLPPTTPGFFIELEQAWPSFVRPAGLATRAVSSRRCCGVVASGGQALEIFAAREGGTLAVPLDVVKAGHFAVRVDGVAGPDMGDYDLALDGVPLPRWLGYAPSPALRQGTPAPARWLAAGRHVLEVRYAGRAAESRGDRAVLDALVGTPAP
jgi:hypothetical protein